MCFFIDERFPEPFTAERPIVVIKRGKFIKAGELESFKSAVMDHVYIQGQPLPHVTLYKGDGRFVQTGYHAWLNPNDGYTANCFSLYPKQIMIIPVGAKYYINRVRSEVVASDIMFYGHYTEERYNKLCAENKCIKNGRWETFKDWIRQLWH